MLLGLVAFDYWILRKGGRGWQMLFEVHGLPSLGISISGILAAVGTLVTTLLTKPELIEMFLDLFAPNVPTETVQSFLKLLP
jgi:hypothetical protein